MGSALDRLLNLEIPVSIIPFKIQGHIPFFLPSEGMRRGKPPQIAIQSMPSAKQRVPPFAGTNQTTQGPDVILSHLPPYEGGEHAYQAEKGEDDEDHFHAHEKGRVILRGYLTLADVVGEN